MVAASAMTTKESSDVFRFDQAVCSASFLSNADEPLCCFCGRLSGYFTRHDFLRPPARGFRRRHLPRDAPS